MYIYIYINIFFTQKLEHESIVSAGRRFQRGDIEHWNPNLGVTEQAELLPYDEKWEFPTNRLKLGKPIS